MAATEDLLIRIDADLQRLDALIQRVDALENAFQAANSAANKPVTGLTETKGIINELIAKEKALTKARDEANDPESIRKYNKEIQAAQQQLTKFRTDGIQKVKQDTNVLSGAIKGVGVAIAAAFTMGAITSATRAIFDVTSRYQTFNTVLTSTLGSQKKAADAFDTLNQLAAKTPFSVEELVSSFNKLTQRGLPATTQALTQLGDLSSSLGKSFDQLTEAVIDATVGEWERLKEFGIKGHAVGKNVELTFKGVTTTMEYSQKAVFDYIAGLGKLQGVQGGMAAQSQTLAGRISTLSDNFNQLLGIIGTKLLPVFNSFIDGSASMVESLKGWFSPSFEQQLDNAEHKFSALFETVTSGSLSGVALKNAVAELNKEYGNYLPKLIEVDEATGRLNITEDEANSIKNASVGLLKEEIIQMQRKKVAEEINADAQSKALKAFSELKDARISLMELDKKRNIGDNKSPQMPRFEQVDPFSGRTNTRGVTYEEARIQRLDRIIVLEGRLNAISGKAKADIREQMALLDEMSSIEKKKLTADEAIIQGRVEIANTTKNILDKVAKKQIPTIDAKEAEKAEKDRLAKLKDNLAIEEQIAIARANLEQDELKRKLLLIDVDSEFTQKKADLEKQQTGALKVQIDERTALQLEGLKLQRKAIEDEIAKRDIDEMIKGSVPDLKIVEKRLNEIAKSKEAFAKAGAKFAEDLQKGVDERQKARDEAARTELITQAHGLANTLNSILGSSINVDPMIASITKLVEALKKGNADVPIILESVRDTSAAIGSALQGMFKQQAEADLQSIQQQATNQLAALEDARSKGLISEQNYARNSERIKQQQAARELEIRRKQAIQEKVMALFQVAINTAVAVAKAVAASPTTFGLPFSAIAIALGIAQAALIAAAPLPKAEKGGLIKGARHSNGGVKLEAEGGEFIQSRKAVQTYGVKMMEAINAGTFKPPRMHPIEFGQFMPQMHPRAYAEEIVRGLIPVLEANRQQVSVNADEHGFNTWVNENNRRTQYQKGNYHSH